MMMLSKKFTATIPDEGTVATVSNVDIRGELKGYSITVPQLDGTTTVTLAIADANGVTVYSKASIAENATTTTFVDAQNAYFRIPLIGPLTVTVTASGTQSTSAMDVTVVIYYEA